MLFRSEAVEGIPWSVHDSSCDRGGELRAEEGDHLSSPFAGRHSPLDDAPDISFVGALGPYPGQAGVRVGDATLVEDVNEAAVEETVLDRCVRTILLEDLVRIEGTVGLVTTNHVQEVACQCGARCRESIGTNNNFS